MLLLTFYHGLRVSELCNLKYKDLDLLHGRLWIARLKGSLSTEQPLLTEELRALKRYLPQRGDGAAAVALSDRARRSIHALCHQLLGAQSPASAPAWGFTSIRICCGMAAATPWPIAAMICG